MRILILILFLSTFYSSLIAGGIRLKLDGHRQLGMGGTGTAFASDASVMVYNPGALAFVQKRDFQFGIGISYPITSFLASTPSNYLADMNKGLNQSPLYLHANFRFKGSRFVFGLSAYQPYGYLSAWELDWKGQFIIQESSLSSLFLQPTISYQLNENFGLGVGFIYGLGSLYRRKALPINRGGETESFSEFTGVGRGVGLYLGGLWQPNRGFSLGLSVRSPISLDIRSGQATFIVPESFSDSYPTTDFSSTYQLPANANIGISLRPSENLVLNIDINYENWAIVDTMDITLGINTPELVNDSIVMNFKDAWSLRVGAEYLLNEKVRFRGGVFYEGSPVRGDFVSPELPDSDRLGVTAGFGYQIVKFLSIDAAYQFEYTGERSGFHDTYKFFGIYEQVVFNFGIGLKFTY